MTCDHIWLACQEGGHVCCECGEFLYDWSDLADGIWVEETGTHSMDFSTIVGGKYDVDKADFTIIPIDALEEIAHVLMAGAEKYSPDGWKSVPDSRRRYTAALLRHALEYMDPDRADLDNETGRSHIAHAACCCLFLLWGEKHGKATPPVRCREDGKLA